MLLLLIFKYKEIDLCIILILGSIFSILWRSIKIIYGKDKIEKNNEGKLSKLNKSFVNPFFLLDFIFGLLGYICICYSKQINNKFIILIFSIFMLAWILNISSQHNNTSQTIHFCGHCYVLLIFLLTFNFYI
jgi:hypothetical protein